MRPIDADALVVDLEKMEETYMLMWKEVPELFKEFYRGKITTCCEVILHVIRNCPTVECKPKEGT